MGHNLKIGVSACLLGENCRYDGGNKLCQRLLTMANEKFELVPVCAEKECGFPIPRAPMDIIRKDNGDMVLIERQGGNDVTRQLVDWSINKVEEIKEWGLSAFVLKSKSPSCALRSASVYTTEDVLISTQGRGFFARLLKEALPELLVCEESELDSLIKLL